MYTKKYILLFCFVCCLAYINTWAQQAPFYFNHIPAQGDTLLTGWKYQPGDDTAWAHPSFQDGKWDSIPPSFFLEDFMKKYPKTQGWFRLRLAVAPEFRNKIVGVSSDIFGATEMYLNGKLLRKLGNIDSNDAKVNVMIPGNRPFPVLLSNDSIQVIAIRFAYKKHELYIPELNRRVTISVTIGNPEIRFGSLPRTVPIWVYYLSCFFMGLNFVLFILHGFFYAYYRRGVQNLYYALYTLFSLGTWSEAIIVLHEYNQHMRLLNTLVMNTSIVFTQAFLVMTIYTLFNYTKRWAIGLLLFASITGSVVQFFANELIGFAIINLLPILYIFEALRVTWKARKRRERGAFAILSGILLYILFWAATFVSFATQHLSFGALCIYLGSGCLMVLMSIAIARQLANTNVELLSKLTEIEELSKEKEEMLTKQNAILEEKVSARTAELNESLEHLKRTQSQLIHSEKMASLGELTAGIAHEIQNPLNFVNNFSEVNIELLAELQEEVGKGNLNEVKNLANNINENEEKIRHHGKRADSIVKGMLQHSRSSTGLKEAVDINTLTSEYLNLAYRGFRAKDKSFIATVITDFDESAGMVRIVPQDIGRVILNLVTNAFYALSAVTPATATQTPTVTVSTKKAGDKLFITVKDNGTGIPEKIKDKIFQPFFTTKPTGDGTGLGLSLSYDMITKGHGGSLTVVSKEGEGATFIIELPI